MMHTSTRSMAPWRLSPLSLGRWPRLPKWFLLILASGALLIPALYHANTPPAYHDTNVATAAVIKGTFRRVLTQTGVIRSQSNITLVNHCEVPTSIVSILPEGTEVSESDLIVQLDDSELQQSLRDRHIRVIGAETALKLAQEDRKLQQLTNESLLSQAQLKSDLAELDLKAWSDGKSPQQLFELRTKLALAEEAYTRSQKNLEYVKEGAAKGYRTMIEVEQERINLQKARQAYELAQGAIELFHRFTHPRAVMSLSGLNHQAAIAVKQRKRLGEVSLRSRDIRVRAAELALSLQQEAFKAIERNIAACQLRAPRKGEVVYAEKRWSRSGELISEGSRVSYQDPIIQLPDRECLQVTLAVHESLVRTLNEGQPAAIHIEAMPHLPLSGSVKTVNLQPRPGNFPNYELRENEVIVEVQADPTILRQIAPGLTASVQIETLHADDAVMVPIESVVEVTGKHYAMVCHHGQVEPREVQIGETSDHTVVILHGLTEGERVASLPRSECADLLNDLNDQVMAVAD